MGFEYKIAFRVTDEEALQAFISRLPANSSTDTSPDYTVALEPDGFYFCDHCKSTLSSQVFRKLVDEALSYSNSDVVVREL